jgi:hypothetical protein
MQCSVYIRIQDGGDRTHGKIIARASPYRKRGFGAEELEQKATKCGGSKAVRKFVPIIQNDRQVFRVVITKSSAPKQTLGLGHVLVLQMRQAS